MRSDPKLTPGLHQDSQPKDCQIWACTFPEDRPFFASGYAHHFDTFSKNDQEEILKTLRKLIDEGFSNIDQNETEKVISESFWRTVADFYISSDSSFVYLKARPTNSFTTHPFADVFWKNLKNFWGYFREAILVYDIFLMYMHFQVEVRKRKMDQLISNKAVIKCPYDSELTQNL